MPIIIKDISWTQTDGEIKVLLKFKTPKSNGSVDVFTSHCYLKIHSPPYFWECFLYKEIKEQESKCQVFNGKVQFILKKAQPEEWNDIEKTLSAEEKATIRDEALKDVQKKTQLQIKEKVVLKQEKKREEIMQATSRDSQVRTDYENMLKNITDNFRESMKNSNCFVSEKEEEKKEVAAESKSSSKSKEVF